MKQQHLIIAGMATVVAAVLVTAGSLVLFNRTGSPSAAPTPSLVATSRAAAPSPTPSAEIVVEPTLPPSPTPTKTTAKPKVPAKSDCFKLVGKNQSYATVKNALNAATAKKFWTVTQISIPRELVQAISWQESGWQSACRSQDGGIGAMQVQQTTADWMNDQFKGRITDLFGRPLDPKASLHDNTMLGSFYLQWLVKTIGDDVFKGNYNLSESACAKRRQCLLNAVISAYQAGAPTVIAEMKDGDSVWYPNAAEYVDNVRYFMDITLPQKGVPLPIR